MESKECKSKCVGAGSFIQRQHITFNSDYVTPIIYDENLKGLVTEEELKVPHSELAMHVGAAGKDIICFFMTSGGSAHIVWDDGKGCCGFTSGLDDELLSSAVRKQTQEMWHTEKKPEPPQRMII